jgi:hypothetical protein
MLKTNILNLYCPVWRSGEAEEEGAPGLLFQYRTGVVLCRTS